MPSRLHEAAVAVAGLGLMGGSLAAALCLTGSCRRVIGVARRQSTLTTALDLRFIHQGATDLREGVYDADIVVLATPVRDVLAKIPVIGPWLKPGCLLMDVGSTKGEICHTMASLPPHVHPLGGHPMCGKETSGLAMADPSLYRDRVFVLCPLPRTGPEAYGLALEMVQALGAVPVVLDPERHDRLVAAISHLPYLLAVTLLSAASRLAGDDAMAWRLAAGGFRDTSRVGAGNVTMMLDILATNRGQVLQAVREAREQLGELERCLEAGDWAALEEVLLTARNQRLEVYP